MSKFTKANKKIAEGVVKGYQKIEEGVVAGYQKIETGAVKGFDKITSKCIEVLFTGEGESVADARARLAAKSKEKQPFHE